LDAPKFGRMRTRHDPDRRNMPQQLQRGIAEQVAVTPFGRKRGRGRFHAHVGGTRRDVAPDGVTATCSCNPRCNCCGMFRRSGSAFVRIVRNFGASTATVPPVIFKHHPAWRRFAKIRRRKRAMAWPTSSTRASETRSVRVAPVHAWNFQARRLGLAPRSAKGRRSMSSRKSGNLMVLKSNSIFVPFVLSRRFASPVL